MFQSLSLSAHSPVVSVFVPIHCRGKLLWWWLSGRLIYKAQQNVIKNTFIACLLFALILLSFLLSYKFSCLSTPRAISPSILKAITPILTTHLLVSVIIIVAWQKHLKGRIRFLQGSRSFCFFGLGLLPVLRPGWENGDRSVSRKRLLVGRKQSKQWEWGVEESLLPKCTSPTNWYPEPVQPSTYNTLQ